jgi:transcriptional regulator with XRE-family HTH domain
VATYHNKKETKRVGERINYLRKKHGWNIEDLAAMTGFSRTTLTSVENGSETDTSHLIEIAKAIGVHPKDIFDIQFELRSRYRLPGKRKDRNKLTHRINQLIFEIKFFEEARVVSDVVKSLKEHFKVKANPIQVSVVLVRFVKEGILKSVKNGRKNYYTSTGKNRK